MKRKEENKFLIIKKKNIILQNIIFFFLLWITENILFMLEIDGFITKKQGEYKCI